MKTIKTTLMASLLAILGCSGKLPEGPFYDTDSSSHVAMQIARRYHGGVKDFGSNLDWDRDGMNDSYVIAKDGTAYHTRSRNLLTGKDTARNQHWYKNSAEEMKALESRGPSLRDQ
jgi:hypothetical protein